MSEFIGYAQPPCALRNKFTNLCVKVEDIAHIQERYTVSSSTWTSIEGSTANTSVSDMLAHW